MAIPPNAQAVIDETMRAINDPIGRPLPLATSFYVGELDYSNTSEPTQPEKTYLNPIQQVEILNNGHYWLPALRWPGNVPVNSNGLIYHSYYGDAFDTLAEWGMPFTMITSQWEDRFGHSSIVNLPVAENPYVINMDGTVRSGTIDPLGAIPPWYSIAAYFTSDRTGWADLAARYPNPPKILFLSNNESRWLYEYESETSKRWVDTYGLGQTDNFKREVFVNEWQTRYENLFLGLRDGIAQVAPSWVPAIKMIGYDVNEYSHYGRYPNWMLAGNYYPNHIASKHKFWDGGSTSYYHNPLAVENDFTLASHNAGYMNYGFVNGFIYSENPDYWFEFAVWDGFDKGYTNPENNKRVWYESIGDPFTPERYRAWIRFGMWASKPRAVRDFRSVTETQEDVGPEYLQMLISAVDEVHNNPLLKRFWRLGIPVLNNERPHPFDDDIPPEYAHINRWYQLNMEHDVPLAVGWGGNLGMEVPVWAMAHVLGTAPNREWLIYTYSPKQDRTGIRVKIPDYCTIVIDSPQDGVFIHIQESVCPDISFGSSPLILYFDFNNLSADPLRSFEDMSGNGHYARWAGQTPASYIDGRFGKAVKFNNLGDNLKIYRDFRTQKRIGNALVDGGTLSFWIQMTQTPTAGADVFKQPGPTEYFAYFSGDRQLRFNLNVNGINEANGSVLIPLDGLWHHVVLILGSDRVPRHYLDNVLKLTGAPLSGFPQYPEILWTEVTAVIGFGLVGAIDDFRIYDRPLTIEEISALYNGLHIDMSYLVADPDDFLTAAPDDYLVVSDLTEGFLVKEVDGFLVKEVDGFLVIDESWSIPTGGVTVGPTPGSRVRIGATEVNKARAGAALLWESPEPIPDIDLTLGLIGHWTFDESTGDSAADSSTNNNTATWGTGLFTRNTGKVGANCIEKTTVVMDQFISLNLIPSAADYNLFTISFWIWPDANGFLLTDKSDGTAGPRFFIDLLTYPQLRVYSTDGTTTVSKSHWIGLVDQTWKHVSILRNAGALTVIVDAGTPYVDSTGWNANSIRAGTQWQLMGRVGTPTFLGRIDDLRIYNRLITAAENAALYNLGVP